MRAHVTNLIAKLDAPPPTLTLDPRVRDIEKFLQLSLEVLHFERMLAMLVAPLLVAIEQLGRCDFVAGCDVQLLGHELFQMVHFLLPNFGG